MFDLFAMLLSSIASFLFPIFASYKALKTSDPAQLTPWLMYWVVFSCCLLVESWFSFILFWIPFYGYLRLFFLLYLILPQTQGARRIYEDHVHPFLEDNETQIDDFIASAHDRLKAAGVAYIKLAIEWLKTNVLGMPPTEQAPQPVDPTPQSYTQSLLARFSVPATRWANQSAAGTDFYSLLAGAVSAATGAGASKGAMADQDMTASGNLIPSKLRGSTEKMTFIAAQRERLNIVLSALDREAQQLQREETPTATDGASNRATSMSMDGVTEDDEPTQRPPSGLSMWSALSKSRSEVDFEKIDAESGAEDNNNTDGIRRRRTAAAPETPTPNVAGGSWMPRGWGGGNGGGNADPTKTGQ